MISRFNLEKAVFKLPQNLTSKLKLNGFLVFGRAVSRCSWRRSHNCLGLVSWTFYLFRLMFQIYLSQGLQAHLFYACLTVRRWFSVESSSVIHGTHWCVQWHQMTLNYLLCCLIDVQCNVLILFSLIRQYIYYCMNNPTGTL